MEKSVLIAIYVCRAARYARERLITYQTCEICRYVPIRALSRLLQVKIDSDS